MIGNTDSRKKEPREKKVRMDIRVRSEVKELLDLAASLSGRNATDIVTDAVAKAAQEEVERYQTLKLNVEAAKQFAEAMSREPVAHEGLMKAGRAHRKILTRD